MIILLCIRGTKVHIRRMFKSSIRVKVSKGPKKRRRGKDKEIRKRGQRVNRRYKGSIKG
jgi:hypothetical protein